MPFVYAEGATGNCWRDLNQGAPGGISAHGHRSQNWERCLLFIIVVQKDNTILPNQSNLRWTDGCATIDNMNDSMITTLPRLVRIGDLARLTGLSIPHLRRLADEGVIPTCRRGPGHHRLFPLEEATQRVRKIINRNW